MDVTHDTSRMDKIDNLLLFIVGIVAAILFSIFTSIINDIMLLWAVPFITLMHIIFPVYYGYYKPIVLNDHIIGMRYRLAGWAFLIPGAVVFVIIYGVGLLLPLQLLSKSNFIPENIKELLFIVFFLMGFVISVIVINKSGKYSSRLNPLKILSSINSFSENDPSRSSKIIIDVGFIVLFMSIFTFLTFLLIISNATFITYIGFLFIQTYNDYSIVMFILIAIALSLSVSLLYLVWRSVKRLFKRLHKDLN